MDERKESTHGAADMNSDAQAPVPNAGNVTPGTTPKAGDLTEDQLEDVVGGGSNLVASVTGGGASIMGASRMFRP
jgi:hypothetical protein